MAGGTADNYLTTILHSCKVKLLQCFICDRFQGVVFVVKHFTIITYCNVTTPNVIPAASLWFYNRMITWLAGINWSAISRDHHSSCWRVNMTKVKGSGLNCWKVIADRNVSLYLSSLIRFVPSVVRTDCTNLWSLGARRESECFLHVTRWSVEVIRSDRDRVSSG